MTNTYFVWIGSVILISLKLFHYGYGAIGQILSKKTGQFCNCAALESINIYLFISTARFLPPGSWLLPDIYSLWSKVTAKWP